MAKRPVFIPTSRHDHLVEKILVDFEWNPGFPPSRKKNVAALHEAAQNIRLFPLLEISSKSEEILGRRLSAFSLKTNTEIGEISLESAYQGSKVFQKRGPYTDIYFKDCIKAKRDERLKESGQLIGFNYFGVEWPLKPETTFYDWLYLSTLRPHQNFLKRLYEYKGFTDIEFNPQRSINCQARSCALLVSLLRLDSLDKTLSSQQKFIEVIKSGSIKKGPGALGKDQSTELRHGSLAV